MYTMIMEQTLISEYAVDMKNHPLWDEYQETMTDIRKLQPQTLSGDPELNRRLDLLMEYSSDLNKTMALDVGVPDERFTNPLWNEMEDKMKALRTALYNDDEPEKKKLLGEIKELDKKLHPELPNFEESTSPFSLS